VPPNALVVVPAFNEQAALPGTLAEVLRHVPPAQVVVIDDGSRDDTAGAARAAGVPVVRLPYNLGIGGALRTGFSYALEHGFARVVQVDGDGQHDPAEMGVLLAGLDDGADLVIGSRFLGGGYDVSRTRGAAMRLLGRFVHSLTGQRFTDTSSGFRAFGPRAMRLFARRYPAEYLSDTVEAILIACRAGLTVREVPVRMRVRAEGKASTRHFRLAYHYVRLLVVMAAGAGRKEELA
jgi:glycosyltransferase involved in cell wall biosynthesis